MENSIPSSSILPGNASLTTEDKRSKRGHVLVVLASFFTLFSLIGIMFYGLPFFYDFWVKDYGWSRATVTSGNAIAKVVVGLFGFLAGWCIDRFGPKKLMIAGVLLTGTAFIGLSQVTALWQFYVFYFFSATAYMFGGPLPNQVLISRWFTTSRGKAMGFAYLGVGIGGMMVPQLAKWLNASFGWHNALLILGFLIIGISLPFILFIKENAHAVATPQKTAEVKALPINQILKSRSFYLLVIGSMCSIAAVSGTVQNLKLFFSLDLKEAQSFSANIISLVLMSSIVGRLLMGWLADKISKKTVMVLIYTLAAVSIPLLFFAKVPGVIYLFAFLFGVALGGDYMIIPLMAAELFGLKVMGRVMGLVIMFDSFAEALSPLLVGWLRDKSGSYANGFSVLIVFAFIGIVAVALLRLKRAKDA